MKYLVLIFKYVFSRSLVRTDILSAAVSAVMPAVYYFLGKPMPENLGVTISVWIASSVAVILLMRLLFAPYFIWKEDQEEKKRLSDALTEPSRQRRIFYENQYLGDRAQLAKDLAKYAMVDAPMESISAFDANAHLSGLSQTAVLLLGNQTFKQYWDTFCLAFRNAITGAKFATDNKKSLSDDHIKRVSDRFSYDIHAMKAAATAMIYMLTENDKHRETYMSIMDTLNADSEHVFNGDLQANLWTLPKHQSRQGTGKKTQP